MFKQGRSYSFINSKKFPLINRHCQKDESKVPTWPRDDNPGATSSATSGWTDRTNDDWNIHGKSVGNPRSSHVDHDILSSTRRLGQGTLYFGGNRGLHGAFCPADPDCIVTGSRTEAGTWILSIDITGKSGIRLTRRAQAHTSDFQCSQSNLSILKYNLHQFPPGDSHITVLSFLWRIMIANAFKVKKCFDTDLLWFALIQFLHRFLSFQVGLIARPIMYCFKIKLSNKQSQNL